MIGHRSVARGIAVVVGAATLIAGTLASTAPASAQWHRSDVGAGIAAGAATGLAVGALAGAAAADGGYGYGYAAPAYDPSCSLQWQRVWNGY